MTPRRDSDRVIAIWLTEIAPESHVDYLDETLEALDGIRQRPAWASPGRWLPMQLTLPRVVVPRAAPYLALLALLLIGLMIALAVVGGQQRLPAPFGLAATGLIAFESEGDILVADADGSGRRPLIATPGGQWSPTFSRRGDRIAYWSAPTPGDPASLYVADADGANARLLTGEPRFSVPDALPALSWSPDDQRLAVSSDGVLYVVNVDGTDVQRIGKPTHQRSGPVWSPDGTLIAYTGQPQGDPYTSTSSWVIAPDGTGDEEVIPAEGGYEIANVNPSWSPDSRSLLVHTGVAFEGEDTDIYIAQRDAAGQWSYWTIVGGLTRDYHPSWSNSGTQFSFIRIVEGSNPEQLQLMVANADGLNVRRVSNAAPRFNAQCWSPDDRFIRSFAPYDDPAQRTMLLIPLDGSAIVEIPAPGEMSMGVCSTQRLAD
jgi:dipeptidyl aminopeptidase/acylaminoacyl peptidase